MCVCVKLDWNYVNKKEKKPFFIGCSFKSVFFFQLNQNCSITVPFTSTHHSLFIIMSCNYNLLSWWTELSANYVTYLTHSAGLPTASTCWCSSSLMEVWELAMTKKYFLVNLLILYVSQGSQMSSPGQESWIFFSV